MGYGVLQTYKNRKVKQNTQKTKMEKKNNTCFLYLKTTIVLQISKVRSKLLTFILYLFCD